MKTTRDFLDDIKARYNLPSDYALAPLLGITRSAVSRMRTSGGSMSDVTAVRVAELLDLYPGFVAACCHAERAKKDEEKAMWASVIEKLGGLAASIALGVSLFVPPSPTMAGTLPCHSEASRPVCIM